MWPLYVLGGIVILGIALYWSKLTCRIGSKEKIPTDDTQLLRLGQVDRWYAYSHEADAEICYSMILHFASKGAGASTLDELLTNTVEAFTRLVRGHGLAQCTYVDNDNWTREGPSTYVRANWTDDELKRAVKHVRRTSNNTWQDVVATETRTKFVIPSTIEEAEASDSGKRQPLVRATVVADEAQVNTFDLVLSFHHTLSDGLGSAYLTSAMASELAKVWSNKTDQVKPTAIHPCNDDVFDMRPSYGDVVYFFVRDNVPILLGKKPYLGPPSMPEKVHEHRAQNLFVNFNSHQTRLLAAGCRQHKTTVQGALQAAAHFGVAALVTSMASDPATSDQTRLAVKDLRRGWFASSWETAANLRALCEPKAPVNALRSYITGVKCKAFVGLRKAFWTLAAEEKTRIGQEFFAAHRLFGAVKHIEGSFQQFFKEWMQRDPNGRDYTVAISNLGRVALPKDVGPYSVQSMDFVQDKAKEGPLIVISATTGVPMEGLPSFEGATSAWPTGAKGVGELHVHIGYPKTILKEKHMAAFQQVFKTTLLRAIEGRELLLKDVFAETGLNDAPQTGRRR